MSTTTLAQDKRDPGSPTWRGPGIPSCAGSAALPGRKAARWTSSSPPPTWTARDEQRLRFLAEELIAALSPSNVPLHAPTSAKMAINTAGLSLACSGAAPTCSRTRARPPVKPIFGRVSQVTQTGIIGGVAEQDRRPHGDEHLPVG